MPIAIKPLPGRPQGTQSGGLCGPYYNTVRASRSAYRRGGDVLDKSALYGLRPGDGAERGLYCQLLYRDMM